MDHNIEHSWALTFIVYNTLPLKAYEMVGVGHYSELDTRPLCLYCLLWLLLGITDLYTLAISNESFVWSKHRVGSADTAGTGQMASMSHSL